MKLFEKTLDSDMVYDGRIIKVYRDDALLPNGSTAHREVVHHMGAVAVLAIDKDENAYFVNQYRYPVQKELFEVPAGKMELGEITKQQVLENRFAMFFEGEGIKFNRYKRRKKFQKKIYAKKNINKDTIFNSVKAEDYPIFDDLYDEILREFQRTDNEYIRTMLRTLTNYVSKFSAGGRNASLPSASFVRNDTVTASLDALTAIALPVAEAMSLPMSP